MKKIGYSAFLCFVLMMIFMTATSAFGLERGAILYHTSKNNQIYGRDAELLLPESLGDLALGDIKSGHVGLYIGQENEKHRIIHAVAPTVVETDSNNFIPQKDLDEGCVYMGAKVPINYATWKETYKDQLILLAKEQVGASYDLQFRHQKGPYDDGFTCVGLVEYLYEQVGYDITPSGYYAGGTGGITYTQEYNSELTLWLDWYGVNTFAYNVEFSKFEHPASDAFNVGMIHEDERYLFFPYTQYLQSTIMAVTTDIDISGGSGDDSNDDGGTCFIATSAYGSRLPSHVRTLRTIRDRYLPMNASGRTFVEAYHRYSTPLAELIGRHEFLRPAVYVALFPILGLSQLILWGGPLTIPMIFTFLFMLPAALLLRKRKRIRI